MLEATGLAKLVAGVELLEVAALERTAAAELGAREELAGTALESSGGADVAASVKPAGITLGTTEAGRLVTGAVELAAAALETTSTELSAVVV